MFTEFLVHILTMIGIFTILSVSLNLALGYTGLINLGHIAFFGIGAYASGILTTQHGVPFIIALLIGGVIAMVFGWFLTFVTSRLKGDYFALATLGFSFVVYALLLNWFELTRGPLGIASIERPVIFGIETETNLNYLMLVILFTIISVWILHRVVSSRYGKLLEATRDDEIGLTVYGKNVFRLKVQAMMLSAFFAGVSGSLYAHFVTFIEPNAFYLTNIVVILTIVIVGGLASIKGSVIASFIILILPELLRFLDLPPTVIGPMREILYALILILILLSRPKGLFGRVDVSGM